jgi:hypothetical protein
VTDNSPNMNPAVVASCQPQEGLMTLTAEEAAALDFEPWPGKPDDLITDGSRRAMETNRITTLLATLLMFKTKSELVEWIREDFETADELMKQIWEAQSSLQAAMDVLSGAEARLICAGSVLELEDRGDNDPDGGEPLPWRLAA